MASTKRKVPSEEEPQDVSKKAKVVDGVTGSDPTQRPVPNLAGCALEREREELQRCMNVLKQQLASVSDSISKYNSQWSVPRAASYPSASLYAWQPYHNPSPFPPAYGGLPYATSAPIPQHGSFLVSTPPLVPSFATNQFLNFQNPNRSSFVFENNGRGTFPMAESSLKNQYPQENSHSASGILDIQARKKLAEEATDKTWFMISRPVRLLDPGIEKGWAAGEEKWASVKKAAIKAAIARNAIPGLVNGKGRIFIKRCKNKYRTCPEAGELREKNPNYVPVIVEKDARSNIPDIDAKKYLVHGELPLGEFAFSIRLQIELNTEYPIFVSFKNSEPPVDALMSAIDKENKDDDGFLHLTYSGEGKALGSINHEQEWREKRIPGKLIVKAVPQELLIRQPA